MTRERKRNQIDNVWTAGVDAQQGGSLTKDVKKTVHLIYKQNGMTAPAIIPHEHPVHLVPDR